MSLYELIAAHVFRYLNSHLEVTRKVVYNDSFLKIMSDRSHSGSKTTIDNVYYTSFLGEDWTFLEYTMRKANVHG